MNGEDSGAPHLINAAAAGENCANRNKESNTHMRGATSPTLNLIIAANLIVGCSSGGKKNVFGTTPTLFMHQDGADP
jgi:hypothetical protein